MNRDRSKKIKGKGWNGIAIDLKETENFDLLNLVEMNPNKYPYFLESSSRGNILNRYSIVFYKPQVLLVKNSANIHFLNEFDKLWDKNKVEQDEMIYEGNQIPFYGGWFVYLGYEIAKEIEKKIVIPASPYFLPDAFAARVNTSIIYDHVKKILILTSDKNLFSQDFNDILSDLDKSKFSHENFNSKGSVKIFQKELQLNIKHKLSHVLITFIKVRFFRQIYQDYGGLR